MDVALNTLESHSGKLHPFSSTFSRKCQAPLVPGGLTSHQCFLISFFIKERGSLTQIFCRERLELNSSVVFHRHFFLRVTFTSQRVRLVSVSGWTMKFHVEKN